MIFGTLAIAGGAVLIAIFGIVPEPTHSLEDLIILLRRRPFVVYFSLLGAVVFGVLVLVRIFFVFLVISRVLTFWVDTYYGIFIKKSVVAIRHTYRFISTDSFTAAAFARC
jgi:hypothetical protein